LRFLEIVFSLEKVDQNQVEELLGVEGFTRFFIERVGDRTLLKVYLSDEEEMLGFLHELIEVKRSWVEPNDWLRKFLDSMKSFEMIPGVLVVPSLQEPNMLRKKMVIKLTPGVAFGTGLHPTTRMSAHLLRECIKPEDVVADIGCGTGILSVLAAKLGASRVVAVDNDPIAVMKARETAEENDVEIEVVKGNLLEGIRESFDLIVANIYAEVLLELLDQLNNHLTKDGKVILSGIVSEKLEIVKRKARDVGLRVLKEQEEENWYALLLTR